MVSARQLLETAVFLALFSFFLSKVIGSTSQLLERKLGVSQKTVHGFAMMFPAVTVCPRASLTGSDARFPKLAPYNETRIIVMSYVRCNSEEIELNSTQVGPSSVLETRGLVNPSSTQFLNCYTFNPVEPSPVGYDNKVIFDVNMTGSYKMLLFVHPPFSMPVPSFNKVFGSDFNKFAIPEVRDHGFRIYFTIRRVDWKGLPNDKFPCLSPAEARELNASRGRCLEEFLENHVGCKIPWLREGRHVDPKLACSTSEQYSKLASISDRMTYMDEPEILSLTGCPSFCEGTDYSLVQATELTYKENYDADLLKVKLYFRTGRYMSTEQYVIYDTNAYIADIGGYLGLLLGHSLMSLYQMGTEKIVRCCRGFYAKKKTRDACV